MEDSITLSNVISVNDTNCVNCHKCIAVCPIKYCNDGSGETVKIINDMCLGCGACIKACTHDARSYIDDTDAFLDALSRKEIMVAVVAPSIAANFPGQYLKVNSLLRSLRHLAHHDLYNQ